MEIHKYQIRSSVLFLTKIQRLRLLKGGQLLTVFRQPRKTSKGTRTEFHHHSSSMQTAQNSTLSQNCRHIVNWTQRDIMSVTAGREGPGRVPCHVSAVSVDSRHTARTSSARLSAADDTSTEPTPTRCHGVTRDVTGKHGASRYPETRRTNTDIVPAPRNHRL